MECILLETDLLRHLEHDAPPLQEGAASLNGLLAWAYGLLSPQEQAFLQALSVFEGGFAVEQAQSVCDFGDASELTMTLHGRALLQQGESAGRQRYQLLAPIRRFARLRLADVAIPMRTRHMAYFLQYAQTRAEQLTGRHQLEAAVELAADLPNPEMGGGRVRTCY